MKSPLAVLRDLSLRWKILIPFVALSLLTWVVAAEMLGRSNERSIRSLGQAEAEQVATTVAQHLKLRVDYLQSEVALLAVEGQLMIGDRDVHEALAELGPNLVSAFAPKPSAYRINSDVVKVVDGRGRTLLQLRRNLLETRRLEDDAVFAAVRKGGAVGGIVTVEGQRNAYLVGASSIDVGDTRQPAFLVGFALDQDVLSEVGLPRDHAVFVVGPRGLVAATGDAAADPQWDTVLSQADAGEVTVSRTEYLTAVAPVVAPRSPDLQVVVALPAAPRIAEAQAGRTKAWLVLGIGLSAFIVIGLWLSAILTRPLRAVTLAAQDLAAGEFTSRAPAGSQDEIGRLGSAFNKMSEELALRERHLTRAFDKLKRLSETDALTGLLNHRAVHAALDREMARARRHGLTFSVAIVDIDNFKLVNDTYGHPAGDLVIRQVTTVLVANTRAADIVGRHGGDEFMVILPETGPEEAIAAADKLRRAMHDYPMITADGQRIPIRLSLGTASFPTDGGEVNELLACADSNLYQSKRRGGDTVTRGDEGETAELFGGRGFSMLDSLVAAVDNKDRYTRHHSEDVTKLALMMADYLGLSEETQRVLRVAGLLHDVGKIGVPDALLRKPGRLTPAEYEIVKHHAALGAAIIQGIPDEEDIRSAVISHHEHWDGCGFPSGSKGLAIPQLGRILAVADAYSAMTSDRPYRKALTHDEALAELTNGAGTQFDPELVRVFLLAQAAAINDLDELGDDAPLADALVPSVSQFT